MPISGKLRKICGVGKCKIQNKKEKQGKSRKSVPILGKNRGKSGGSEKIKFKIQRKNK